MRRAPDRRRRSACVVEAARDAADELAGIADLPRPHAAGMGALQIIVQGHRVARASRPPRPAGHPAQAPRRGSDAGEAAQIAAAGRSGPSAWGRTCPRPAASALPARSASPDVATMRGRARASPQVRQSGPAPIRRAGPDRSAPVPAGRTAGAARLGQRLGAAQTDPRLPADQAHGLGGEAAVLDQKQGLRPGGDARARASTSDRWVGEDDGMAALH
jgi:hypothetical protein